MGQLWGSKEEGGQPRVAENHPSSPPSNHSYPRLRPKNKRACTEGTFLPCRVTESGPHPLPSSTQGSLPASPGP